MRTAQAASIERRGHAAIVRVRGDIIVPTARAFYGRMRSVARRRHIRHITLDFTNAGRLDSAGVAIISLFGRQLERSGKQLDLVALSDLHKAALELVPPKDAARPDPDAVPGVLEQLGGAMLDGVDGARAFGVLFVDVLRQSWAVLTRRKKAPAGAIGDQLARMGVDAVFIVGLLSFLLGMTMAFQGAVQLERFGAGPFVADMIAMSMVRELGPLITAIILTGRTGAAIAAELGTMQVRSEIDALSTMGISPTRFLIVPRMAAITMAGPALTLMSIFIGIAGGAVVAGLSLDMPPIAFWQRIVERVTFGDFAHGIGKSVVFAWIIGFTGSHLGMRAGGDATSVGSATTRTVVVSIFFIIVVDALFATVATLVGPQ